MSNDPTAVCPLCGRECPRTFMTRHHIKTRKVDKHDVEWLCRDCHRTIHALFENREVAKELNTLESLAENAEFAKALTFIRKQPAGSSVRVKQARRK